MDAVETLLERARNDDRVLAVLLFGSAARGEAGPASDIDVCVFLHPGSPHAPSGVLLDYADLDLDVSVFQALPLFVASRVLKEGKVILCKDEDELYDIALTTVRHWEDFKPTYRTYIEAIAHG